MQKLLVIFFLIYGTLKIAFFIDKKGNEKLSIKISTTSIIFLYLKLV